MKKYFYTGLIALLPIVLTIYIFNWFLSMLVIFLNQSFVTAIIREILIKFIPQQETAFYMQILIYIISFCAMIVGISLVGFTLKMVFFEKVMKKIQNIFVRIPLIKQVYTTISQIMEITMSEKEKAYEKTVMVEYPRRGIYSIGFLTSKNNHILKKYVGEDLCNIFIPTSPNPTSGMFIAVPKKDVIILDIKTDDAIKMIISGGVIIPESKEKDDKISE